MPDLLYPQLEPHAEGMLEVGDGNQVHWRESGNPKGKPVVCLHGGPGTGCPPGMGRVLDPSRYRVIQVDQRGCGASTPHASDPATDMRYNTTAHLVADLEKLRVALGVDRWLLYGGSWGTTLALAYALEHPERVSELVLIAISTTRPDELDWLYRGVARFFPLEWLRFRAQVPDAPDDGVVAAYARLVEHPSAAERARATSEWLRWEHTVLSLEPSTRPLPMPTPDEVSADDLAFVRICAHYYANNGWLPDGQLIREAGRLAGTPGVLVHGRLDLSCPLDTAVELARAWPGCELITLDDTGHRDTPSRRAAVVELMDAFVR